VAHVLHSVEYRVCCIRCGATWTEIDEDTSPSDLRLGARHQHSCRCCGTIVEAEVIRGVEEPVRTRKPVRAPQPPRPRRRPNTTRVSG
jgi:hypothetical protein